MRHTHGLIEVVCGSMFSGKTDELIRRLVRATIAKQKVQVFKPAIDVRYAWKKSHLTQARILMPHRSKSQPRSCHELTRIRLSLASMKHSSLTRYCECGAGIGGTRNPRHRRRARYGFSREPFGPMPLLMSMAESVDKLHAICMVCGDEASRNAEACQRPARQVR